MQNSEDWVTAGFEPVSEGTNWLDSLSNRANPPEGFICGIVVL